MKHQHSTTFLSLCNGHRLECQVSSTGAKMCITYNPEGSNTWTYTENTEKMFRKFKDQASFQKTKYSDT